MLKQVQHDGDVDFAHDALARTGSTAAERFCRRLFIR
jgi:hypothetical protein